MITWYNKETRNPDGKFYGVRSVQCPAEWGNPRDNFTKIAPPTLCLEGDVACDWDPGTETWDIETSSQQAWDDARKALQAIKDSPIYKNSYADVIDMVDAKVTDPDLNFIIKHQMRVIKGLLVVTNELIKRG